MYLRSAQVIHGMDGQVECDVTMARSYCLRVPAQCSRWLPKVLPIRYSLALTGLKTRDRQESQESRTQAARASGLQLMQADGTNSAAAYADTLIRNGDVALTRVGI